MNGACKIDEKVLKSILKSNMEVADGSEELDLIVYCKNLKTRNFVMKSDLGPPKRVIDGANVIYECRCPLEGCCLRNTGNGCIGLATCTLSRRLAYHRREGAVKEHEISCNGVEIARTGL